VNLAALLLLLMLILIVAMSRLFAAFANESLPWYRDAVSMALLPWLAASLIYVLPIFEFRERLEVRHTLYIVGVLACMFLGALVARFLIANKGRSRGIGPVVLKPDAPALLWSLALLGVVSQVAIAAAALGSRQASLIETLTGQALEASRLQNNAMALGLADTGISRLAVFGAAAFVYVCMVAGGCLSRAPLSDGARRWLRLLALACGALIAFNGVLIRGGRMELVLLLGALLFAALLDGERHVINGLKRRFARSAVPVVIGALLLGLGGAWYLATGFTQSRIGTASAYSAMEQYHRTKPSAVVDRWTATMPAVQFAVLNLSYLPVPLTTFSYYYDLNESLFPGPYFGQYNFTGPVTFLIRRAGFRDEQKTMQEIRFEATRDLRMRGYGDNVWATVLRDMAFDAGWWGVPLVMFFTGWGAQALLLVAGRSRGGVFLAMGPIALLFVIFTLAHSLFVLESFAVAAYMCLAVFLSQRFFALWRPGGTRRSTRSIAASVR